MHRLLVAAAALVLQACATTEPGTASGIHYRLPRSDGVLTLGVDVTECSPIRMAPSLQLDAVAGAQPEYWHLSGSDLASGVIKRNLVVAVDENGVLSTVNSAATDQRAAIVGDVIKVVAAVLPMFAVTPSRVQRHLEFRCSPRTVAALSRVHALQVRLATARSDALKAPDTAAAQKQIDALAAMMVDAQTPLHRDLVATVAPEDVIGPSFFVRFEKETIASFAELVEVVDAETHAQVKTVDLPDLIGQLVAVRVTVERTTKFEPAIRGRSASSSEGCSQFMVVPNAKPITLTASLTRLLGEAHNDAASRFMYASQKLDEKRDEHGTLCVSAGLGENRTIGLKLDKFGHTTEFTWIADARAANIAAGLAGAAPDVATIATTLQGRKLAKDRAELDRLTLERDLQKARQCQAILNAGGTTCP